VSSLETIPGRPPSLPQVATCQRVTPGAATRCAFTEHRPSLGFAVEDARNGAEAVAKARARPGLILMDRAMPILDGRAAMQWLASDPATARIPVLAMRPQTMALPEEGWNACVSPKTRRTRSAPGAHSGSLPPTAGPLYWTMRMARTGNDDDGMATPRSRRTAERVRRQRTRWPMASGCAAGTARLPAERCSSDDAALARATETWQVLREKGWTEPSH
jgi:hypothetical protein